MCGWLGVQNALSCVIWFVSTVSAAHGVPSMSPSTWSLSTGRLGASECMAGFVFVGLCHICHMVCPQHLQRMVNS
jgi:ferredoxin